MTTETIIWQADFVVPNAQAPAIEAALDALPRLADEGIYAQFEDGKTQTRFALYINGEPPADLVTELEAAAGTKLAFEPVPEEDWVTKSNQALRSEEHTSELQSLMRISYAVFCLQTKKNIYEPNRHTSPR